MAQWDGNGSQKTFWPEKSARIYVDATLGSRYLMEVVRLPPREDLNE
ncbi:hypothetical protein HanPSC8_Chr10g0449701 [Helianthus annuus]|nr:hypothetical protein HanPSC8_Chr10g0449701 [Helianthus annuus]